MKDEINLSGCETIDDIFRTISGWADYYNHDRYQWDLAKLAPCEYYRYLSIVHPKTERESLMVGLCPTPQGLSLWFSGRQYKKSGSVPPPL